MHMLYESFNHDNIGLGIRQFDCLLFILNYNLVVVVTQFPLI